MNKLYTKCLILLVCIAMLAVGCAKQEEDGTVSPTDPTNTPADTVTLSVTMNLDDNAKKAKVVVMYKVGDEKEQELVKGDGTKNEIKGSAKIKKDSKVTLILFTEISDKDKKSVEIKKLSSDVDLTINYQLSAQAASK